MRRLRWRWPVGRSLRRVRLNGRLDVVTISS